MAIDYHTRDIKPMLSALKRMHGAAAFGAVQTSFTVNQLKILIDDIHQNFNSAKSAWTSLVAEVGAGTAAAALARTINPVPADVPAALATIQTDTFALLGAYAGSAYGTGTAAFTYSAAVVGGLIDGGHTAVVVSNGVRNQVNALCVTLRDSLAAIAPE